MSNLFSNKCFAIKPAPAIVRTERVPAASRLARPHAASHVPRSTASPPPSSSSAGHAHGRPRNPPKRKLVRPKSAVQPPPLSSDSSDSESPSDLERQSCKRPRLSRPIDKKRKLRGENAFSHPASSTGLKMIHAADLVSPSKSLKSPADAVVVKLHYPSDSKPERYALVFGEDFNPAEEIINVVNTVLDFYLTKDEARRHKDSERGIIRKLTKAYNLLSKDYTNRVLLNDFKAAVEAYNSTINDYTRAGNSARKLDLVHEMPLYMVECILQQVYARAVSPKVEILKRYENGTDNVYGELLPPFVSRILEEAGLTSDNIFVDLGSGVGNVVLQAALEFGCESWGCEMMKNACTLAEAQKKEFSARCRLWGVKAGLVNLQRGDFLDNPKIHAAMQKADVILVNNQAFTPDLNQKLKDLFLDLKNGCRIISLKSFVHYGHQISSRNLWDPANILDVVEGDYHSRSVSWTDAGGKYYISTKDEKRLKCFSEQQ